MEYFFQASSLGHGEANPRCSVPLFGVLLKQNQHLYKQVAVRVFAIPTFYYKHL